MSRRSTPKSASEGKGVTLNNPAELVPTEPPAGAERSPTKQFTVQIGAEPARAVRGAHVWSMYHGAVDGLNMPTDWINRATRELLFELEAEHNGGQPFPVVKGRIPRSARGGALAEDAELDQFNVYLPVEIEGRMRGALMFFRSQGMDERQIRTKAEFYTVAVAPLVERLEEEYGVDFASYYSPAADE